MAGVLLGARGRLELGHAHRSARRALLAGALEGEGSKFFSSADTKLSDFSVRWKFLPCRKKARRTRTRTEVCAAPALPSAAAFARAALYGSVLPFRAVCARQC